MNVFEFIGSVVNSIKGVQPHVESCPFCLSEDTYLVYDELELSRYVECGECGATGPHIMDKEELELVSHDHLALVYWNELYREEEFDD